MTRWGDLLERTRPTPTAQFYVARGVNHPLGIGTLETPHGTRPVMSGDVIAWSYAEEPALLDGASVDLVGPLTEEEATTTTAGIAAEARLRSATYRSQAGDDARARARLILGPQQFYVPPDNPQYEDRVDALAEVIFWARGYPGQELPR